MAKGTQSKEVSTPRQSSIKKVPSSTQSNKNQKSILGFFQKKSDAGSSPAAKPSPTPSTVTIKDNVDSKEKALPQASSPKNLTPAPSSDAPMPSSPLDRGNEYTKGRNKENGLPSPITPSGIAGADSVSKEVAGIAPASSPSRRAKKAVNYAESDDEDSEVFKPISSNLTSGRSSKRRKVITDDSDDEFGLDDATQAAFEEEDMDDFIVADDSEEETPKAKKRKRTPTKKNDKQSSRIQSSPPRLDEEEDEEMTDGPKQSTASQWNYDPNNLAPLNPKPAAKSAKPTSEKKAKQKAHMTEPDQRYPWLANILDKDRNPPGHPDYDPRTIYVPPMAWKNFSPFEKQYWEIKQNFWDTVVFFKKGKFYELYENDATIGHQLFDLKLTDRVNMRMVGVPEASLDQWANQFVAKGYKIARVDQMESALAKEMRERDDGGKKPKAKSEDKVIRRELAAVLTSGTLVDGSMLQDDLSTFCAAIKEEEIDGRPVFGIAFVDAATAQFQLCYFEDDVDMTKFETFVAQTRPGELLLEKSCISAKALRILKNNTSPTTIWNYLKPGKEFWTGDVTCREIEACSYFEEGHWPAALNEAKDKDIVMSAFGALLQYLRLLKIERDLVTLGNFSWYDPIQKATSLVLDGQSLINLEIFANSLDGTMEGTLFSMLNRCVTPFGKRMLRQWVCHPLADARRINARLDAVDALNADNTITDRFTASLTKLPDLERLISRVHTGKCKVHEFIKVLEGFEQIEYTMSLLSKFGEGEGVIGQLIASMPDLSTSLKTWRDAFDRKIARDEGILVPEPGVEEDFDNSQAAIDKCLADLDKLLNKVRRDLGSTSIVYRDNGKEIYQLEVPIKIKNVPKNWDQMSATAKVKRYYSPELRVLVRNLQEAQETHGQIVKDVAGRFFARFDEDYSVWLAAVKIIAQLDCLISLAKASSSLGEPSCRPIFTDDKRTVIEFEDLRHPCMLNTVSDFIPNDIKLGGDTANIDLLTGANAAGKSTILRMTCVAVIMAQVGCYLPCASARLTPIDRIMSRLGANDNIFAAQSTFYVELSETKKILSEATPRSLVILDELGRGTSSYDGVAVAQAVLHHVASHIGCIGFFATHYHSLAAEFAGHPEIAAKRMRIHVDDEDRRVTFLYKLEEGVAEGSFGMHCASMCGIPKKVVDRAEEAAREWEHTGRLKERLEAQKERGAAYLPLGMLSDVAWVLRDGVDLVSERGLEVLMKSIEKL